MTQYALTVKPSHPNPTAEFWATGPGPIPGMVRPRASDFNGLLAMLPATSRPHYEVVAVADLPAPDDTEINEVIADSPDFASALFEIGEKYSIPLTSNLPRWQDGVYVRESAEFYGEVMDAVRKHLTPAATENP